MLDAVIKNTSTGRSTKFAEDINGDPVVDRCAAQDDQHAGNQILQTGDEIG